MKKRIGLFFMIALLASPAVTAQFRQNQSVDYYKNNGIERNKALGLCKSISESDQAKCMTAKQAEREINGARNGNHFDNNANRPLDYYRIKPPMKSIIRE